MGRTGGAAARGFGKGTAVRGPRGIPSVVSATAVGTVENASNGKLNLTWTNTDATAQTRIYNGATLLATENAGTTTKSLTTLDANTAYTLTVKHYKDSIESAGSNFSAATTYQYNGCQMSSYCGGDSTYELFYTYANGNNSTYDTSQADWDVATCGYVIPTGTVTENGNYEYWNSGRTTTWTVPGGVTTISVDLIGGGGGGGGAPTGVPGTGGGGGGHVTGTTSVAYGDVLTIVIGRGGSPLSGYQSGWVGDGGASSITSAVNGVLFTANGGGGGTYNQYSNSNALGGTAGGAGAQSGRQAVFSGVAAGGRGGYSYAGTGGLGSIAANAPLGYPQWGYGTYVGAAGPGGGGGGGYYYLASNSDRSGGYGSPGRVIITYS